MSSNTNNSINNYNNRLKSVEQRNSATKYQINISNNHITPTIQVIPHTHNNSHLSSVNTSQNNNINNNNKSNANNNNIQHINSITNSIVNNNNEHNNNSNNNNNQIKYHSPLSILLQQQTGYQQRIVRTNHIQLNTNINNKNGINNKNNIESRPNLEKDNRNTMDNKNNMRVGHNRINNIQNIHINIGNNMQSPKVQSSSTPNNKIFNDIKYMRTPNKISQQIIAK